MNFFKLHVKFSLFSLLWEEFVLPISRLSGPRANCEYETVSFNSQAMCIVSFKGTRSWCMIYCLSKCKTQKGIKMQN